MKPLVTKKRNARDEALSRLIERYALENQCDDPKEQFERELSVFPEVSSLLRNAAGGLPAVFIALRSVGEGDARRFIEFYDSLSKPDRKALTLEEISVAAGIDSRELRNAAVIALMDYESTATKIMLGSSIRSVLKVAIKNAKTDKGWADRNDILKAGRVLPTPSGSTTIINPTYTSQEPLELPIPKLETPALPPWDKEAAVRNIHQAWGDSTRPASEEARPLSPALDTMQQHTIEAMEDV